MPDALRLALGTLTVLRVPPPRRVTPTVAGRAMLLAPWVGALLALLASALPWLVGSVAPGRRTTSAVDLLTSVLVVGALALLTRGLHLDGLADTADGLGVKGPGLSDSQARERRLAIMREPDTGAFGVATIVLVVLLQVTALAACTSAGLGIVALLLAAATGRLAATWCASRGVPSARTNGLGAAVAGSVPRGAALGMTAVLVIGAAFLGHVGTDGVRRSFLLVVALLLGLAAGATLLRRCVTRFGGITGDVIGAVVEVTTTTVLVAVALGAADLLT
jgi:adenosylcobinamide-GDP ribazoletransferase